MTKQNVRQQELMERYRDLLRLAINWAHSYNKENLYEAKIPTEEFLTEYGLLYGVGEYAKQRYFKEFETYGAFVDTTGDAFQQIKKEERTFRLEYKYAKYLGERYNLHVPTPKPKEEQPIQEAQTAEQQSKPNQTEQTMM